MAARSRKARKKKLGRKPLRVKIKGNPAEVIRHALFSDGSRSRRERSGQLDGAGPGKCEP